MKMINVFVKDQFSERIKNIRILNDMTMSEFACKLNTNKSNVNMWENGNVIPRPELLVKISKEFDISIDYLLGVIDVQLSPRTIK